MNLPRQIMMLLAFTVSLQACANPKYEEGSTSSIFKERWFAGVGDSEPALQIQAYDENTFVIRQSLNTNFEAPFMYLIFGQDKALLIDTGAGGIELRDFIDAQLEKRAQITGKPLSLTVMHSHAHGDHVAGDNQFTDRPDTRVIGKKPDEIAAYFGMNNWPDSIAAYDLGMRSLDIIPTPGHQESHVMVLDHATGLLFSGDVIYPGRLYFRCGNIDEFKQSIDRVADHVRDKHVSWVMGAHIELSQTPGKSYGRDDVMRTNERLLELPTSVIGEVQRGVHNMSLKPRVEAFDNFTLFPVPENPQGKSPPDWCEN